MNAMTRLCVGSKRFDIEPHEAPTSDFPKQPSQKDGLGRKAEGGKATELADRRPQSGRGRGLAHVAAARQSAR